MCKEILKNSYGKYQGVRYFSFRAEMQNNKNLSVDLSTIPFFVFG